MIEKITRIHELLENFYKEFDKIPYPNRPEKVNSLNFHNYSYNNNISLSAGGTLFSGKIGNYTFGFNSVFFQGHPQVEDLDIIIRDLEEMTVEKFFMKMMKNKSFNVSYFNPKGKKKYSESDDNIPFNKKVTIDQIVSYINQRIPLIAEKVRIEEREEALLSFIKG